MFFFDPMYLLFIAPALLLAMLAQGWIRSAYHSAMKVPAHLSGAAAARHILDQAGLQHVEVEMTPGTLSDHYDPRHKVLRLSPDVYEQRSAAAVGIAAHEAGHALQDAKGYLPLVLRNAAVPAAQFGPWAFMILVGLGIFMQAAGLIYLGIACFGAVVVFQVINLPVEFDASARAKRILTEYHIVDGEGAIAVNRVLNAAAMTYVAATLQSILTLAYYVFRLTGGRND